MKTTILVTAGFMALLAAISGYGQNQTPEIKANAEQEVLKLEQEWSAALVKLDSAVLNRILSDDLTRIDPEGVVWTKAQTLAVLRSGEDVKSSLVSDDMRVLVYGDTAVVTGRDTIKETLRGRNSNGIFRWTDTGIKIASRWQCVATRSLRAAQK